MDQKIQNNQKKIRNNLTECWRWSFGQLQLNRGVLDFVILYLLSHGIIIPIWLRYEFTICMQNLNKKLMKITLSDCPNPIWLTKYQLKSAIVTLLPGPHWNTKLYCYWLRDLQNFEEELIVGNLLMSMLCYIYSSS